MVFSYAKTGTYTVLIRDCFQRRDELYSVVTPAGRGFRRGGEAMRLKGRVAVVTGGSRGIGRAIALALAEEGADVAVNYQRNEAMARDVARAIERTGRASDIYQADVSDPQQVQRMRDAILTRFQRVDILVNNAGINRDKSFAKMDDETWRSVIAVNLNGVFYCTKVFLDAMAAGGHGRIINISSIVGQMGNFGQSNYAAAKAGLLGFTKTLARELAGKGITVNAIAPGFIETEMVAGVPDDVKQKLLAQIPLRRFGKPEEVAKAVVFLSSEDASYITGHVLNVNGGMYV
jgi:3-oxoacyl-(acyl-carrier-protein) reductase